MRTTEFLCEVLTGAVVVYATLAMLLAAPVEAQTTRAPGSCHVLLADNVSYLPCSAVVMEREA